MPRLTIRVSSTFVVIFAMFAVIGNYVEADCTDAEGAQSTTLRLKKLLFCEYDRYNQPVVEHETVTEVKMFLYPKFLVFYDLFSTLQVHSWMDLKWIDETLSWNKTEYDNIDALKVPSETIWLPDLDIDELSDNEMKGHRVANIECTLNYTGAVECVVATTHSALCVADWSRWPFDQHSCMISIQSWSRAERINLTISKEGDKYGLSTRLYQQSREWELLNTTVEREIYLDENNMELSKVVYFMTLKRFSGEGAAGVAVPAIVLACLTWLTFLLESRSTERLSLICINILCHCLYLLHMCTRVPPNGDIIPLILLFYRDSLLMAASSLIITIFVRKMDATSSSPPSCVAVFVNGVLATHPGQMLLLSGVGPKDVASVVDAATAEGSGPNRWRLFGKLVDYLSLASCVLVTFVLIIRFLL